MLLFLPLLKDFETSNIKYLVVGGVATILHGFPRLTGDVDIILGFEEQNCQEALRLIEKHGYRSFAPVKMGEFASAQKRSEWIKEKNMRVFSLYNAKDPILNIDLFVEHPLDFEAAYARSELKKIESVQVRVCSIEDLIELKKIAKRPKDLEDIKALELIKSRKK